MVEEGNGEDEATDDGLLKISPRFLAQRRH